MPRYDTAGSIINLAASEVGLTAVSDPFSSNDPAFVQLCNICTSSGRELLGLHEWQRLTKEHSFVTTVATEYDLPDDFGYMIDQTQWDRSADMPLGGPLTPQEWAYRLGSDVGTQSIYVSFRVSEGVMKLLPDPQTAGVNIVFEYVSREWVQKADLSFDDKVQAQDDVILYEPALMVKFLKLRFLEAKGFDTTAAMNQFTSVFMQWTGKDISAPILSMAYSRAFPYLGYNNIPESGFGS